MYVGDLASDITINRSFITVAGQTSPDGICIRRYGIRISGHDILIQHLAIRPGDEGRVADGTWNNLDCLQVNGGYNIVLDHMSYSWGIDENASIWGSNVHDVTFSNLIIAEGLQLSAHTDGVHSKGLLIGGSGNNPKNIAVIKVLFAHNNDRHPQLKEGTHVVIANTVAYNCNYAYSWAVMTRDPSYSPDAILASWMGNTAIDGPNWVSGSKYINVSSTVAAAVGTQVYQNDNLHVQRPSITYTDGVGVTVGTPPIVCPNLTVLTREAGLLAVLTNAGSRPAFRDAVDTRIADPEAGEVISRTGAVTNHSPTVWPVYGTTVRVFDEGTNPHGISGSGYTNLEVLIHAAASLVELGTIPSPAEEYFTVSSKAVQPVSLSISPNPSNGTIRLFLNGTKESAMVSIFDISGRVVHSVLLSGEKSFCLNGNIANGVYFARLYIKNRVVNTVKFLAIR